MALLPNGNFDAGQYQDMRNFDPIPEGWYPAQMIESELKQTKDYQTTQHQYYSCKFEIMPGQQHSGRFFWTNLNLINSNPTAVKIASEELATMCRAMGRPGAQDTVELHNIPLMIKINLLPGDSQNPPKNEIKGYKPFEQGGGVPAMTGQPAPFAGGQPAPQYALQQQPPVQQQQPPAQPAYAAPPGLPTGVVTPPPAAQPPMGLPPATPPPAMAQPPAGQPPAAQPPGTPPPPPPPQATGAPGSPQPPVAAPPLATAPAATGTAPPAPPWK